MEMVNIPLDFSYGFPLHEYMKILSSQAYYEKNPLFFDLRQIQCRLNLSFYFDFLNITADNAYFPTNNQEQFQRYISVHRDQIQHLESDFHNGNLVGPSHRRFIQSIINTKCFASNQKSAGIALSNAVELSSFKLLSYPSLYTRFEHDTQCMAQYTHWSQGFQDLEMESWNVLQNIENCNKFPAYMGGKFYPMTDIGVFLSNLPSPSAEPNQYNSNSISTMDMGRPM